MQSNSWSEAQQRWTASGFPVTIALMVLTALTALMAVFAPQFYQSLMFVAPGSLSRPWTTITYSILGAPSIFTLFDIGLIYWFGSSLERAWGTKAFSLFWITVSVVSALSLSLGSSVLNQPLVALPILPLAGAAFVWAFLNADERLNFFFLPMRGIYFAGIAVLYILFNYAGQGIASIPFALVSCLVAFGWLKYGVSYQIQSWGDGLIPMSRPAPRPGNASGSRSGVSRPRLKLVSDKDKPLDDRFTMRDLNPFEWYAKRKRRKQFEKLVGGDD